MVSSIKWTISFVCFAFIIESITGSLRLRRQVTGGDNADIRDFPYQASIRMRNSHFCGGTIIGNQHILTAAHCFTHSGDPDTSEPYSHVTVHTGTSSITETGDVHRVASVTMHPEWTQHPESDIANDIAVITIAERIIFNQNQKEIQLASRNVISGKSAMFTGWGNVTPDGYSSPSIQLQKLQMTLLTNIDCEKQLPIQIVSNQLCAYSDCDESGACMGDSGGPLVADNEIVGIASWIYEDNGPSIKPEVYTNVYAHRSFIRSAMGCD